jgi:glycosyltransferase involved in cell wall biosynthesis
MVEQSPLLISIIVPVYNTEDYLSECLDSLLHQTYNDIEVVIVNDGSTDSSSALIESYKQKDTRVKVVNKKNAGVSAARNDGLRSSIGDYVLFVDSDDYLTNKRAVELMVDSINSNNWPDIVMFKRQHDGNDYTYLEEKKFVTADIMKHMVLTETLNTLWNKLYKRDAILEKHLTFHTSIRMGEDLLFNIEYFSGLHSLLFLDQELYYYREDNIHAATKKYMNNKYDDLMHVNDGMMQWAKDADETALLASVQYIRMKNVLSCMKDLHHKDCQMTSREKKQTAVRYKWDNPGIIIKGCGLRVYAISLIYNLMNAGVLYGLTKVMTMRSVR